MFDKVQRAFVRMGRAGLYARMDFGENAAAATPLLVGKAMRLVEQGQPYTGIVLYSQADREDCKRNGPLRIHFAPLPLEGMSAKELARVGREVGIAITHCLALEGLQADWSGQADENILVTGECPAAV